MRCFVSYAVEDRTVAREVVVALRAAGHEVWFDEDALDSRSGDDGSIRGQILEAIARCEVLIPLLSPRFVSSVWAREEYCSAWLNASKIAPVELAPCDLPPWLPLRPVLRWGGHTRVAELEQAVARGRVLRSPRSAREAGIWWDEHPDFVEPEAHEAFLAWVELQTATAQLLFPRAPQADLEVASRELSVRLGSGHQLNLRLSPLGEPPVVDKRIVFASRVFGVERFRIWRLGDEAVFHAQPWRQVHRALDLAQAIAAAFIGFGTSPHRT